MKENESNNPYEAPLIKAIDANDVDTVRTLLKEGQKPDLIYAFSYGGRNVDPKILDLLLEYNALPEGVSLSTLKLTLFANGCSGIPPDFMVSSDLDPNGVPGRVSPIARFTQTGNLHNILLLMALGVKERPIHYLFLGGRDFSAYFIGCNPSDVDGFRKKIVDTLSGRNRELGKVKEYCKVGAILLSMPTNELDSVFEEEKKDLSSNRFLPLFAWAAINNKIDLLDLHHFEKLFHMANDFTKENVAVVAAAFGSKEFLVKAIQKNILLGDNLKKASIIAAANGDKELLASLMKFISVTKESGIMFRAVRNGHINIVEFLINSGVNPNENISGFECNSYLKVAARFNNIDMLTVLLSHGAKIDYQDYFCNTALHDAAVRNNLEALKILLSAGANKDLVNENGEKPLMCISDERVLREIKIFIAAEAVSESNPLSQSFTSPKPGADTPNEEQPKEERKISSLFFRGVKSPEDELKSTTHWTPGLDYKIEDVD